MPNQKKGTLPTIILGFDFGMKSIGTAIGQAITRTATPLKTLTAKDGIPNWDEIKTLIIEWRPRALIVGIPLNMDGTEQPLTVLARRFMNRLKARYQLPVYAVDERLTTWEAKSYASTREKGMNSKKPSKSKSHAIAAAIIVEQWFNAKTSNLNEREP